MTEKKTEWFVEADALTNAILADQLTEAEECPGMLCEDGVSRNLWRLSAHDVAMLHHDRRRLNLNFTTFCRVDSRGIHISFLYNSPQKRSAWKRFIMKA